MMSPFSLSTATTERLAIGRELFNERRYFEAHEAWEDAWRVEDGEAKQLLQALILVAAGCHKATLGEPGGTVKLFGAALEKLAPFPDGDGPRARALLLARLNALPPHEP